MAGVLRSQYSDLFGSSMLPVLEELFRGELKRYPSMRDKIFKTVSTDRDIWQASELHDVGLFNTMAEGEEYSFERGKQGASKTLTISKYGLGVKFSEESISDGKFDLVSTMVKMLAESAAETQELNAFAMFNNGFDSETSADGQFVFDQDHSLPSGSTFRNELAVAADLSVSSLDQMLQDFETQFLGDSGIIKNIKPKWLIVHPSNKRYAHELVNSDLKADTPNNNANSFKELDQLSVATVPWLTDTDSFYITGNPEKTGLRIVSREGITTKAAGPDLGFKEDSVYYKSRFREKVGVTHAYGIFGSPGAG